MTMQVKRVINRKFTFYKPNGEAMPNLPADPRSMERYLKRGFTLTPPLSPKAVTSVPVGVEEQRDRSLRAIERIERIIPLPCNCGFAAKSEFGLRVHQRKHLKEKS